MLYRPGTSFLHRADPRAKLFLIAAVLFLALMTTRLDVLALLTLAVVLGLMALGRITPLSYWKVLLLVLPLIVLLTLLQALVQGGEPIAVIGGVPLSKSGTLLGLGIGLRLVAMGICFYGFSVTTSPSDISLALDRMGVPYKFAYLTSFAFRFLPLMQEEASTLLTAMAVRGSSEGSSRNPIRRGRAIVRMLFPMLVGSMKRSGEISLSMELRGYGLAGPRSYYRQLSFDRKDALLVIVVLAFVVALIAFQMQYPGPFGRGG